MGICRPLGAGLFFYECLRLLLLVFFLLAASPEGSVNGFYPVYMSSNALFPLMALFIWLKPEEYKSYVTLYIAGKIIALISFYAWEIFSFREFLRAENLARNMLLFGGGALLSLADILSVWGAWTISKKHKMAEALESGGV
jgi:hypothetical protein